MAKDLIQIEGLLIAFTGIIFTEMLAEVRFRTEGALQAANDRLTVEPGLDNQIAMMVDKTLCHIGPLRRSVPGI